MVQPFRREKATSNTFRENGGVVVSNFWKEKKDHIISKKKDEPESGYCSEKKKRGKNENRDGRGTGQQHQLRRQGK